MNALLSLRRLGLGVLLVLCFVAGCGKSGPPMTPVTGSITLDDQPLTAGHYGEARLIACAFGYTIPTAWEAALAVASSVRFAGCAYWLDGAGTDYPSSPLRRYEALTAMGYL